MALVKGLKEIEDKLGGVVYLELFADGTGAIYRFSPEYPLDAPKVIGVFDDEGSLKELIEFLKEGPKED
jgi:hypothetical protein